MRIRTLVLAAAVISSSGVQMRSQTSGPPPSPPVGTKEDPAKALDGLLSMMEFQVVGAAKAMPADKYSFAPAQASSLRAKPRSSTPCAPLWHR